MKGQFVLAASSIPETKRIQYLLGLCSPAEREHIQAEFFEDEDAFEAMLTAEDDLIDAYVRGELAAQERRRFEKNLASSLSGRDRVQFARAFAGATSAGRPVEIKFRGTLLGLFRTFRSPGLLRTATIAAVILLVAVLAWLVSDRRRTRNELRELHAQSAELSKRTKALQRSSDTERTRTEEIAAQLAKLRAQPDKPGHRERGTTATQRVPGLLHSGVTPSTTIRGTAKDPQGNIVTGATVTLTEPARKFTRTQSTDENGAYVFTAIPPGTYSIEVKAPGFKTVTASSLVALVDTPSAFDVQLEVGAMSERVHVSSSASEALINTSDASIGNSFERARYTQLPLNARNVANLLSLQPGVSPTRPVNGERGDQSNITLDGVDVDAAIIIPRSLTWIRFQIALKTAVIHDHYRFTLKPADGRPVTSVDWIEPLTPNQTIIDTPAISTGDLSSGDYVLLLMGKDPDGSFVEVARYSIKVIKN